MGLFDRFKRRVKEVSNEVDTEELTVEEDSIEGQQLASAKTQQQAVAQDDLQHNNDDVEYEIITDEDDWEVFDDEDQALTIENQESDDDWEDFDDEEDFIPQQLTRKEKKRLQKEQKQLEKAKKAYEKAMKKRGAMEVARPAGSKVDLSMMRTTTGRKLVKVAQAPKGSVKLPSSSSLNLGIYMLYTSISFLML